MQDEILQMLPIRKGHFRLESGHHGDLWLDLELLCLDPQPVRRFACEIAAHLAAYGAEMVCGPLVEGAFIALLAAWELGLPFCYSERIEAPATSDATPPHREPGGPPPTPKPDYASASANLLYPVKYRIPTALRPEVQGKRVAIVNDVINAGSAVRGTVLDLSACGAQPIVIATLLVLGSWAPAFAEEQGLALETLATLPNTIWTPDNCPLCRQNVPLLN